MADLMVPTTGIIPGRIPTTSHQKELLQKRPTKNRSHFKSRLPDGFPKELSIKHFTKFIYIRIKEYLDDDLMEEFLLEAFSSKTTQHSKQKHDKQFVRKLEVRQ